MVWCISYEMHTLSLSLFRIKAEQVIFGWVPLMSLSNSSLWLERLSSWCLKKEEVGSSGLAKYILRETKKPGASWWHFDSCWHGDFAIVGTGLHDVSFITSCTGKQLVDGQMLSAVFMRRPCICCYRCSQLFALPSIGQDFPLWPSRPHAQVLKWWLKHTPGSTLGNAGVTGGGLGLPITRLNLINMQWHSTQVEDLELP
jgi:hypothetical protein